MDLKGIISISGKPGLYKVAAQGRNNIIVQSLDNDKKFPAFASDKISALDDISIYTHEKDVPLVEVLTMLAKKEAYKPSISPKEEPKKLREYLVTFLPDYDSERVYDTDVKKLFQWYNILVEKGVISEENEKAAAEAAVAAAETEKVKTGAKSEKKEATVKAAKKPKATKATDDSKPAAKKKSAKKS